MTLSLELIVSLQLFERGLFASYMYPTSVLLTWAVITISGVESAAYYYFGFLALSYYLFGLPTKSCFRLNPTNADPMSPGIVNGNEKFFSN